MSTLAPGSSRASAPQPPLATSAKTYRQATSALPRIPLATPSPKHLLDPKQYIFVDNTDILPALAMRDAANLLTGPRRFGKSTLIALLLAFLELSYGEALEVFHEGTAAGRFLRTTGSRAQRKVISISFDFVAEGESAEAVLADSKEEINFRLNAEAERHGVDGALKIHTTKPVVTLHNLIGLLTSEELGPPAVLIDEYDCPIITPLMLGEDPTVSQARLKALTPIFRKLKDQVGTGVHCVYVTGINQLSWGSMLTAGNNLKLLSFLEHDQRPSLAFTWEQIEDHFAEHIKAYCEIHGVTVAQLKAQLREMYDGYAFHPRDPTELYNPWSVLSFFESGALVSHWGKTTGSAWLAALLKPNVVEALCPLAESSTTQFKGEYLSQGAADPTNLSETEQAVVLVHAGDLSIARNPNASDADLWTASVPNGEIRHFVLPYLLEKMYHLPPQFFSEEAARLVADGRVGEYMALFAASLARGSSVSSREGDVHFFETFISGGFARSLSQLGERYPKVFAYRGHILNEVCTLTGQPDVAWTTDETDVVEFKVSGDKLGPKGAATAMRKAKKQVRKYAAKLLLERPGPQRLWVAVFSRSGSLRSVERVPVETQKFDRDELDSMKLPALKEQCGRLKLTKSGRKRDVIERLMNWAPGTLSS